MGMNHSRSIALKVRNMSEEEKAPEEKVEEETEEKQAETPEEKPKKKPDWEIA